MKRPADTTRLGDLLQAVEENPNLTPTAYAKMAKIRQIQATILFAMARNKGLIEKIPAQYKVVVKCAK